MKKLSLEILDVNTENALANLAHSFRKKTTSYSWDKEGAPLFSNVIFRAVETLRNSIEDPNFAEINLSKPFIETGRLLEGPWEQIKKILSRKDTVLEKTYKFHSVEEHLFSTISNDRMFLANEELNYEVSLDALYSYLLSDAPVQDRILFLNNLNTPFSIISFHGKYNSKEKIFPISGNISIVFLPLQITKSTKEARFPMFVGLTTQGNSHEHFSRPQLKIFWNSLLQSIKDNLPCTLEDNSFGIYKLAKPRSAIIKSPMHLESQKFGLTPKKKTEQLDFFASENAVKDEPKIEVVGLDLSSAHFHALNAIQKILAETNYHGHEKGKYLERASNSFKFEGFLPTLKFSRAKYLEAFGVKKYQTGRGKWEFSGAESHEALRALTDLGTKQCLIIQKRHRWENNKQTIDRLQTVSTVLRICGSWKGLSIKEDESLDRGDESKSTNEKLSIIVEPCPLLVDQIDSHFILRPANTYQEIKLKFPGASKFSYLYIDWIIREATIKKTKDPKKQWPKKIEVGRESLAHFLRMDAYIKKRDWKRIDASLKRCIEIATKLNWINDCEVQQGKTIGIKYLFHLNQKKFNEIQENKTLPSTK